ncbi:MAG: hypothetical protein ACLRLZ_00780 [Parasutterella excrementihominis]|uniref:hypothetical protein n=1 Tax=Parasutterella excrementihominis TaxID=487175 RepID=UPI0039931D3B
MSELEIESLRLKRATFLEKKKEELIIESLEETRETFFFIIPFGGIPVALIKAGIRTSKHFSNKEV